LWVCVEGGREGWRKGGLRVCVEGMEGGRSSRQCVWQREECRLVEEGRGGGVCVERERKDVLFVGFGVVT